MDTVFTSILEHKDGFIIWEDASHIAFLTPYPNTLGATVVIPKQSNTDYVFNMDDQSYSDLLLASKKVAMILKDALKVPRVALVFEGTGVPYVHAKLYPLHGDKASKTGVWNDQVEYSESYKGYLTTLEGPRMLDEKLKEIQTTILDMQQS